MKILKVTNSRPLKIQLEITVVYVQEFERLKRNKSYQHKVDLTTNRMLAKTNYRIHIDSIKQNIVSKITENQKKYIYAKECCFVWNDC